MGLVALLTGWLVELVLVAVGLEQVPTVNRSNQVAWLLQMAHAMASLVFNFLVSVEHTQQEFNQVSDSSTRRLFLLPIR